MLAFAVEHAHVWTEKFIGGANQKIAIEGTHVNGAMRRVMNGINVGQSADFACQADDLADVVDCSHRV